MGIQIELSRRLIRMRAQIVKYKSFKEDWKIKRKEGTKKENLNDFKRGHKEGKHRKNCECCPVSLLIVRKQRMS